MDLPHIIAQWQSFHDACLAEAKALVDVPGNEAALHSLASTAAVCVDVLQKVSSAPAKAAIKCADISNHLTGLP